MIPVEVYGKRDCCLCDEVKVTLSKVRLEIPFDLYEIDIESALELYETYKGTSVPRGARWPFRRRRKNT